MGLNIDDLLKVLKREQITPCCDAHDACYRTCNKTRAHCDCVFFDCIIQQCISRVSYCIDCFIYASNFYTLVRTGGVLSYIKDQRANNCSFANSFQPTSLISNESTDLCSCDKK